MRREAQVLRAGEQGQWAAPAGELVCLNKCLHLAARREHTQCKIARIGASPDWWAILLPKFQHRILQYRYAKYAQFKFGRIINLSDIIRVWSIVRGLGVIRFQHVQHDTKARHVFWPASGFMIIL